MEPGQSFSTLLAPAGYGPPRYGGSGWSGAWSGQDPSEVLGGPAAASGEIRRGPARSGPGPAVASGGVRRPSG